MSRNLKPCGTRAAYRRHKKAGEEPCEPCREALLADERDRRRAAGVPPIPPAPERFFAKVDLRLDCWIWEGAADSDGYGTFSTKREFVRAHRWSYEHLVGPIPDGLQIDHLCRTPACVNPDHLEPVTQAENIRRSFEARGGWERQGTQLDGAQFRHGTRSIYVKGCRCDPCRTANREYAREHRRRKAATEHPTARSMRPVGLKLPPQPDDDPATEHPTARKMVQVCTIFPAQPGGAT